MDILGGIASLGSGLLNYFGAKEANAQNREMAERNIQLQKDFAQQGIRWKVADAQAAGIHPLYALGASTTSFSPVSVGATNTLSPLADMAKNLGQDLTRSVDATRTQPERVAARIGSRIALEGGALDNEEKKLRLENLRLQNQRLNQSINPPMPVPGDISNLDMPGAKNTQGVNPEAEKVVPGTPGAPWQSQGAVTDIGWSRTPTGWAMIPGKDVKERIEDVMPYEWSHWFRNPGMAALGLGTPPFPAPSGKRWRWSLAKQEYQLQDNVPRYTVRSAPFSWLPKFGR